jgi:hypothetical protein
MEDALLIGFLERLRGDGHPDWPRLLDDLGFSTTDWDFSSWALTRGGTEGNTSRTVAEAAFREAFASGHVPTGTSDLATYMQGDEARIVLVASAVSPIGRPLKAGRRTEAYPVSGKKNFNLGALSHVRLDRAHTTSNIGRLDVVDVARPLDRVVTIRKLGAGMSVSAGQHEWEVRADHYGGQTSSVRIVIKK